MSTLSGLASDLNGGTIHQNGSGRHLMDESSVLGMRVAGQRLIRLYLDYSDTTPVIEGNPSSQTMSTSAWFMGVEMIIEIHSSHRACHRPYQY